MTYFFIQVISLLIQKHCNFYWIVLKISRGNLLEIICADLSDTRQYRMIQLGNRARCVNNLPRVDTRKWLHVNGVTVMPPCRNWFYSVWTCSDESCVEDDLVCLLNTGEVCVFTVPSLRRQIIANVVGRDNVLSVALDFSSFLLSVH